MNSTLSLCHVSSQRFSNHEESDSRVCPYKVPPPNLQSDLQHSVASVMQNGSIPHLGEVTASGVVRPLGIYLCTHLREPGNGAPTNS